MVGQDNHQVPAAFVCEAGQGRRIEIPGVPEVTTVKAGGAHTGGAMSVHEEWHDAGDPGVPRHLYRRHDELFYVLEGRMRFLVGAEEHVVGPRAVVYIPRGTVHAFRPAGQGPARQLLVVTPGGFEGYLDEMRTLPSPREAPAAWRDLQRRWDVEAVGPLLEGP